MPGSAVPSPSTENGGIWRRPLRRLTLELFGVVALKIVLLLLIWWLVFAPHPKPDASPDAIAHLLAPTSHSSPEGHP
jgi:hypothetical protein